MTGQSFLLRSFIVMAAALVSLGAAPTTAFAQQLSRAQAVAQAVGANPEVKVSLEQVALLDGRIMEARDLLEAHLDLGQVALLDGRIMEARADALPDVSWSTLAIRSRDPGLLNSPNFDQFPPEFRSALSPIPGNTFETFGDVQQTIFSFKLGKAIQAARLARDAGQEDVRRARQSTALSAIQGYNQLLFAIEQLRVARSTIEQKQAHVDVARNRRAAGAATELEVLRAEVDLANQRAELMRAETQVSAARARLNTVMLRPTDTPIEPSDVLAAVPVATTFEQAIAEALMTRPELALLRSEVQVRDMLIDVTRADMKPSIDFRGAYGFAVRQPTKLFNFDFTRWAAAVTVKVPVFDGRRTAGRVAQGQAERNIVTERIAALENQVRLDVQSAWDSLTLADRVLAAADLNVAQARRAADLTEANYRLGAATPLDVLDAQQALALAENIRNLALYTHANGRASLSFVMGRDPLTDVAP